MANTCLAEPDAWIRNFIEMQSDNGQFACAVGMLAGQVIDQTTSENP
jgi:hypothetical protein